MKNTVVYGIFPNRGAAESCLLRLQERGFRNTDVSILFSDARSLKEFATEKNSKAPEGTAIGATTGLVLGGTLGWLAGIGALAIPAVGPLIAAGPIMALLAGAGVAGTVGGLVGGLVGMGMPEYEAKRFEGIIKKGGVLLSVHCDNSSWAGKAKDILEESGAHDISSASEARAEVAVDDHDQPVIKRVG